MSDKKSLSIGYISSGYKLNSDGSINGTLNTLDYRNKISTMTIFNYGPLFKNVWGITSPNINNQLLVMTSDSKYISMKSYLMVLIDALSTGFTMFDKTIFYIVLYFILTYGFSPSDPFIAITQMIDPGTKYYTDATDQLQKPRPIKSNDLSSTASPTLTPSYTSSYNDQYSTWDKLGESQPIDGFIKDSYLFYVVCNDIAVNDKLSQYYSKFDNTIITAKNIKSNDWKYAANFYYTLYKFGSNQQETFCVTPTYPAPDTNQKNNIYSEDCRYNESASSVINTPSGSYGQNDALNWVFNNKDTTGYTIAGVVCSCLCCICCIFLLVVMAFYSKKKGHKHGGDYYNLD
jgi:hypothetical protein